MCIRAVETFSGPNMEFHLFKKIIDEATPDLRYLSFDGPGETILNADAFPMIRYAKSRGVRVMFSTNALALDGPMIDRILDSGVDQIIFSVNGATADVYAAVHGCDCYTEIIANISRFLERKCRRRAPILVAVQMIRLPETLSQVGLFHRQWRRVPGVNFVRVKKDVVCHAKVYADRPERPPRRHNPCSRLWHGPLFVETNGDVYASPGVMYRAKPVGNVTEKPLAAIWNGEAMQSMRCAHASGDISQFPECLHCSYPRPRLPLILAGFLLDPFTVGKFVPLAERLAFWHRLPIYEKTPEPQRPQRPRSS